MENKLYKIAVIIPYFGKFPATFTAWKKSVLFNSTIDFYLFTDNVDIETENNLIVKHITFEDYKQIIQNNFDFKITLDSPYKLCDYKPVYGMVFKDLLKGYDFWGYCDMDMVFGDIRQFYTNEVLEQYDKFLYHAHISLYRNSEKMNTLFMDNGNYPEYNYKEVFTTNLACYFDEFRGMELKCIRNNIMVYNGDVFINPNPNKEKFVDNGGQYVASWNNGKLYKEYKNGKKKELLYAHIAKRKMKNNLSGDENTFYICPGVIESAGGGTDLFAIKSGGRLYKYFYYIERLKKNLKNFGFGFFKSRKRMKQIERYKQQLLKDKNIDNDT